MNNKITPEYFFKLWLTACAGLEGSLYSDWSNKKTYTSYVLDGPNCPIQNICEALDLNFIKEYYGLDIVYYDDKDVVPGLYDNASWLRRIRIAFEHEHDYKTTYEEVSHLTITNCDLRVLVTYPENDVEDLLDYYKKIILADDKELKIQFLVIFGDKANNKIFWEGYSFNTNNWMKLSSTHVLASNAH